MSKPATINLTVELTLLVFLAAIWSTSFTFIKIGVATIPPVSLIAWRTLIAAIVLLAVMRLRGISMPRDRKVWGRFVIQACLNSVVPFTLIAWAERTVAADLAVILNATTPIFTFLLTIGITRHETMTPRIAFGVGAGLLGVVLIVGVSALQGLGHELMGQLAILLAAVCYAGAAIFGKNFKGFDPIVPATGSLIAGTVILMPISLIVDAPWTLHPSADSLWALVGLSTIATALPFILYFRLFETLGSVRATAQAFLRVPFGVAISAVILGERLSPTAWVGFGLVAAGVGAMTLGPIKWPKRAAK